MKVEILIILFNIFFFFTNLLYIELVERIFSVKNSKYKIGFFAVTTSLVGTVMLVFFGSMSSLGYTIMLVVYAITVMSFYRKISVMTRLCCVFVFNLHIMFSRAMITSIISIISGKDIIDLSRNNTSFWLILILTSILTTVITFIMLKLLPRKYLKLIGERTDHLILYFALLLLSNLYMIVNGNVYIHDIEYEWLPIHQIVAAVTTLASTYVGVFALVGFDMLKERRETLEQDAIYKSVIKSRSLFMLEINCSKDLIIRFLERGEQQPIPQMSYSKYTRALFAKWVYEEDYDAVCRHESIENIISQYHIGNTEITSEFRVILDEGEYRWIRSLISMKKDVETGDVIAIIATLDDIHEAKTKEIDLMQQAEIDPLVGVLNKIATEAHINKQIKVDKYGALFMIDLDNFKGINDNFGHAYGDEVLKGVTAEIAKRFRNHDIIGRVGGDEFIVFLVGAVGKARILEKAKAVCDALNKVYRKDGTEVEISCSLGIAIAPSHGVSFNSLYQKADIAMYECKNNTKNGYVVYSTELESQNSK